MSSVLPRLVVTGKDISDLSYNTRIIKMSDDIKLLKISDIAIVTRLLILLLIQLAHSSSTSTECISFTQSTIDVSLLVLRASRQHNMLPLITDLSSEGQFPLSWILKL